MLRNTFCHIPRISLKQERALWEEGVQTWDQIVRPGRALPDRLADLVAPVRESLHAAERKDIRHFAALLPRGEEWRLFGEFRDQVVYLDIETTGLGGGSDHITTIVTYDGAEARHFVFGENLDEFPAYAGSIDFLVTFNGRSFDVPFLRRQFGIDFDPVHLDLRYLLRSLGLTGGLKKCEKILGLDRKDLADVDGYMAVLLWREYRSRRLRSALTTLLAYNFLDVINLEVVMIEAFNRKVASTPFVGTHALPMPLWQPPNPFPADGELLDRLRGAPRWHAHESQK